jgi:SAM-dependent methyltransferase
MNAHTENHERNTLPSGVTKMSSTLTPDLFRRHDESDDARFYAFPRLVTHIDETAIAAVTQLYREFFPPNGRILDLMSSWVSHLPEEVRYSHVVGLGMNAEELAANPRLDEWLVQSLNENPQLPFADASFDACGICVSIQYLTDPVAVLEEVARVLTPNAPIVITFSNRCFPTKAVAVWQSLSDEDHGRLVAYYLTETGAFDRIQILDRSDRASVRRSDPLFAVAGRRTAIGGESRNESDANENG